MVQITSEADIVLLVEIFGTLFKTKHYTWFLFEKLIKLIKSEYLCFYNEICAVSTKKWMIYVHYSVNVSRLGEAW